MLHCVTGYLVFDRIRRKSQLVHSGASKPVMLPGKLHLRETDTFCPLKIYIVRSLSVVGSPP